MFRWVPGLQAVSTYRRQWLVKDIVAGVVLTTLLVPQGMAYAELAGLPPITGLYTSILCLLGYAVFGPSRILVLGPDSSLGPMIAATILPLIVAKGDPKRAVALASLLAIMVAVIMIVAGVAKLGFIADLISKPTMIGYLNGLALTILVGQLPKLFGFKVDAEGLIGEFIAFVKGLANGEAVAAALTRRRGNLPPVLVSSFLPRALAATRDHAPEIPRGLLLHLVPPNWASRAERLGCATINVDHRRLHNPNILTERHLCRRRLLRPSWRHCGVPAPAPLQ